MPRTLNRGLRRGSWVFVLATVLAGIFPGDGNTEPLVIDANPDAGFHFPYLLTLPDTDGADASPRPYLLVEPNNTGSVSDSFEDHLKAAKDLSERAIGAYVAHYLDLPLLVPVFPRPESTWTVYTHALDRDVMLIDDGPLQRIDLQLLAMVDDARVRLAEQGYKLNERFLITGFSASGTFANRFALLHPERVQAVASGGVNGILMLPIARLKGRELLYPLGIADFESRTGHPFNQTAWKKVPQLIYMGAEDENDAVQFDDGYSEYERNLVYTLLGETMQPDRWRKCQSVYRGIEADVQFQTYEGIGHGTDKQINDDIVAFFRENIESGGDEESEP